MNPKHPLSTITVYRLVASFILAISIYSCANMSRPGGGPRDETPPVFIKSMPVPNALNVSKQKIEIEFDEIIQVDKPSEKVIVSPPQKDMPEIRTSGRKITVILKDSLLPNTTYTIDFSDAIIDNNERNPLYGFAYSFSTGPKIDSLQVSGILLNARDLEPITGMLVGLHSDLEDSAFQKLPLERIASSDELGHFTIRNVTPGKYRLFALKDMNRDYRFDNPSEDIAFLDSIVIPSADVKLHVDTIWKDSVTIDTIIEYNHTHFYPNDILLTAFNEGFQSQYLDKSERKDRRKIDLYFKAPADSLPKLKPLNFEQEDWAILERSFHNDTLQYWIKDSLIYNMDTLLFTAEYLRTDTLRQLSLYNDILLTAFNEGFQSQYLDKSERKDRRKIDLYFKAPADSLPKLKPLNFEQEDWAILERSFHNDTLQYWIKDSLIYNMDTLLFTAEYLRTDTLRQLSLYNDTLKFIMKKVKAPKKKEKKKDKDNDSIEVPEIQFMQMNAKISSSLDVYKPLRFSFAEPLQTYDAGKIHLEQKRDTLWIPVADSLYTFLQDSIAIRDYTLTYKWTPGESYRIVMDSTAFTNIYGLFTNTYKQEFKVKALEDYANLYLSISGVSDSAFVEILDSGDKPVRTAPVINGGAEFMYMNPGTYYARLFIDRNGNGKYDTGNYSEKRQPEEVSYYPQELELKANWDIEQDWDIYATPVDKQKPDKIKKNKPKEKKRNY